MMWMAAVMSDWRSEDWDMTEKRFVGGLFLLFSFGSQTGPRGSDERDQVSSELLS